MGRVELLALASRLGACGEMQERNTDLSKHGVLQRVAFRLTRTFLVEGISVNLDNVQRFFRAQTGATQWLF